MGNGGNKMRTALETMIAARWEQYLPEHVREFLFLRAKTDVHVHALIAAFMHESRPEAMMSIMAETICRMSQMNEHLMKIATDAVALRPMPPMFIPTTPAPAKEE